MNEQEIETILLETRDLGREVFKDSCNHTKEAIEWFHSYLYTRLFDNQTKKSLKTKTLDKSTWKSDLKPGAVMGNFDYDIDINHIPFLTPEEVEDLLRNG